MILVVNGNKDAHSASAAKKEFLITLTVWLNPEGKKEKNYGIRFKVKKVTANEYISLLERQWGELSDKEKEEIRANPTYTLPVSETLRVM